MFPEGEPIFVVFEPKDNEFLLFAPTGCSLFCKFYIIFSFVFISIPDIFLLCFIAIGFITFVLLNTLVFGLNIFL